MIIVWSSLTLFTTLTKLLLGLVIDLDNFLFTHRDLIILLFGKRLIKYVFVPSSYRSISSNGRLFVPTVLWHHSQPLTKKHSDAFPSCSPKRGSWARKCWVSKGIRSWWRHWMSLQVSVTAFVIGGNSDHVEGCNTYLTLPCFVQNEAARRHSSNS